MSIKGCSVKVDPGSQSHLEPGPVEQCLQSDEFHGSMGWDMLGPFESQSWHQLLDNDPTRIPLAPTRGEWRYHSCVSGGMADVISTASSACQVPVAPLSLANSERLKLHRSSLETSTIFYVDLGKIPPRLQIAVSKSSGLSDQRIHRHQRFKACALDAHQMFLVNIICLRVLGIDSNELCIRPTFQ